MKLLIEKLQQEGCSLVMRSHGQEQCFWQRGVADLLRLLHEEPEKLRGAMIADKVVGKGAAALMALGGVSEVYALTISQSALDLLERYGVTVGYGDKVHHIINRAGTDWCPVEKLCAQTSTAAQCLPLIEEFVRSQSKT